MVFLNPRAQLNSTIVTSRCVQFETLGRRLLFAWTLPMESVLPVFWGGGIWEGNVPNWSVYIDNIKHTSSSNNRSLPVEFYTVCPCNSLYKTVCLTFCHTGVSWLRLVLIRILCKSDSQPNLLSSRTDAYNALQLVVLDRFISGKKFDLLD